ncbi:MAG: class I SAM-dependent methyltransferase [Sandaracinaceae bacterium]
MSREPPGAGDPYLDGRFYDHHYLRYRADRAFYLELAQRAGGDVLEIGVGTGRIALHLARAGIAVTGVDRSRDMLARARQRLDKMPRRVRALVRLVRADLRRLELGRTFALVAAPFNVLMHLYARTDLEAALAACRRHLAPGGLFALDVLNPDVGSFLRDPARAYKLRSITDPTDRRRYRSTETFAYDWATQVQTTTQAFRPEDGGPGERTIRLVQRQFFPAELEALLHYNGFEVLSHEGGFEGEPLDADAPSQVVVARARR